MEVYKITTTTKKEKTIAVKVFENPIEVNKCVDSLSEQKSMGLIDSYDLQKIHSIDIINAGKLMNHMSYGDFIKLVKASLREPTVKTF